MNILQNEADITTKRLGFGLSKLMRIPYRKDRRHILEVAFEHGVRHFDVARMYGLGEAEKELGEFIRSKRDKVIVGTKFGIEPQGAAGYVAHLQSPIRWLFKRFPGVRAIAARNAQQSSRPKQFTPESARTSLETSLRMIGSDYVDLFFLHEPTGEDRISDDLYQCLEDLKTEGKIRDYGISSMARDVMSLVREHPALVSVIQFANDAVARQIDALELPSHASLLTFAPLSTALPAVEELSSRSPTLIKVIAAETGIDLRYRDQRVRFLLSYALHANPRGTVVFASTSASHIAEIADYANDTLLEEGAVIAVIEKLSFPSIGPAVIAGRS
jgi:D-threo-aldose 1-dehydrogenase